MNVADAVFREVRAARGKLDPRAVREALFIRVTEDAIPGSPAAVVVTPERARRYFATLVTDGLVATPGVTMTEVLIHPRDWRELLVYKPPGGTYIVAPPTSPDAPMRVFGVPVVQD